MIEEEWENLNLSAKKVWTRVGEEMSRHTCDHGLSIARGRQGEGRTNCVSNFTEYTIHVESM